MTTTTLTFPFEAQQQLYERIAKAAYAADRTQAGIWQDLAIAHRKGDLVAIVAAEFEAGTSVTTLRGSTSPKYTETVCNDILQRWLDDGHKTRYTPADFMSIFPRLDAVGQVSLMIDLSFGTDPYFDPRLIVDLIAKATPDLTAKVRGLKGKFSKASVLKFLAEETDSLDHRVMDNKSVADAEVPFDEELLAAIDPTELPRAREALSQVPKAIRSAFIKSSRKRHFYPSIGDIEQLRLGTRVEALR